mgnify:CR=1 FL=1
MDDDNNKNNSFTFRKTKWLVGISVIGITAVLLIVYVPTTNLGSSPASVSIPYLSNPAKLIPGVAAGAAGLQSNNNQQIKHIVPLDQIVSGGPPPDGIPSIDNPKFVSVVDASKFLKDSDLVVGLTINGQTKAYPLLILVWHEIVNDKVGGVPVAVTYCPLCFTSQVFNRTISGHSAVEFGTSGKLYNNNLVMYDRLSGSLWSQALGEGIVGTHAGETLIRIPFDLAYWKDWKQLYPNSMVISTDTGFTRPYGADPYGDYYTSDQLFFPISNLDKRLGLKEMVVGLDNEGQYKAYILHQIESTKIINDKVGNKSIVLISLYPRMVRAYSPIINSQTLDFQYDATTNKIFDKQTGSQWNFDGIAVNGQLKGKQLTRLPFDEGFWFSWAAFHPQTRIYPG